jgi:predicted RNA-binding protein with PIN domain
MRLDLTDEMISEGQRKHFLNTMRAYGARKKHTMIVVFDGGEFRWPVQETHKGITVIYAGTHHTADEAIIAYIQRNLGRSMLLVSSDRQLRDEAAHFGVELVHARDFYDRVHAVLTGDAHEKAPVSKAVKTSADADAELDTLMERVMRMQLKPEDQESVEKERTSQAQQLTRKERKRLQKLKKL